VTVHSRAVESDGRAERERAFHDELAESGFRGRRLLNRLSVGLYDKDILWGPVWNSLGDLHGKRVLDYGCGVGEFSDTLWKRGALVHGIDLSEGLVTQAGARFRQDARPAPVFQVMDAHATTFADGFFDHVFGNGILHHLDLDVALSEIARVLRPGGSAFFQEPLAGHPCVRLVRRLTPRARSADERPLTWGDIDRIQSHFRAVEHTEIHLVSPMAAPLGLFGSGTARWTTRRLKAIDDGLFRLFPRSRRLAWLTMLTLWK
jgi:SAM-dependent methyltransferase